MRHTFAFNYRAVSQLLSLNQNLSLAINTNNVMKQIDLKLNMSAAAGGKSGKTLAGSAGKRV